MRWTSPFLMDELERARLLDLIRNSPNGHLPVTAAAADILRRALFVLGAEFLASLAPIARRDGKYMLAGPEAAQCWPKGAAETSDTRFGAGEVLFDPLTGIWEDGNGRQSPIAWGDAIAARIWRRPKAHCSCSDAHLRLFAMIGLAILAGRYRDLGYFPPEEDDGLPRWPAAPCIVPDLPPESEAAADQVGTTHKGDKAVEHPAEATEIAEAHPSGIHSRQGSVPPNVGPLGEW